VGAVTRERILSRVLLPAPLLADNAEHFALLDGEGNITCKAHQFFAVAVAMVSMPILSKGLGLPRIFAHQTARSWVKVPVPIWPRR
jgi:hypothetical protein